ncbi:MAG: hypothetical protein H5T96_09805 [Tissierellales bacterium]|nr:hypothetical protein [Tissierellales bacterium]
MEALAKIRVKSPHDKLEFSSYKANILGSNMKLKEIADKKQNAADLQKAINEFKDETGMKAKNGMTVAKDGEVLTNAERDYLEALYRSAQKKGTGEAVKLFQEEFHRLAPERAKEILAKYPVTNYGKEQGLFNTDLASNTDAIFGKRTEQYVVPPNIGEAPEFTPIGYNAPEEASTSGGFNVSSINDNYAKAALLAQMLPYLRPSDAEVLDPRQLAGEMYSLSQNQLEPAQAQKYSPDLGTPYDISLQDQLNANQADYRATERTIGYNPAALSILNAQKYKTNQQVLGEQFRLNQAEKDKVYGENRNTLNQAKLQNLQILDNQYVRQATAKSNTKDAKLAALNSISSKFLQNKLENRTLQTYENLYNYRYDDKGRAINMNAPALFNIQGSGTGSSNTNDYIESDWKKLYNSDGSFDRYVKKTKSDDAISMNGTILKSYKNY